MKQDASSERNASSERMRRPASAGSTPSLPVGTASQAVLASRDSISAPSAYSVPLVQDLSEWRAAVSTYAKTNAIQGAYHTAVRGASRNASVSREEQRPQDFDKFRHAVTGTVSKLLRNEMGKLYQAVCEQVEFNVAKGTEIIRQEVRNEVASLRQHVDEHYAQLSHDITTVSHQSDKAESQADLSKVMLDVTAQFADNMRGSAWHRLNGADDLRRTVREAVTETDISAIFGEVKKLAAGTDLSDVVSEIRKAKLELAAEAQKCGPTAIEDMKREQSTHSTCLSQLEVEVRQKSGKLEQATVDMHEKVSAVEGAVKELRTDVCKIVESVTFLVESLDEERAVADSAGEAHPTASTALPADATSSLPAFEARLGEQLTALRGDVQEVIRRIGVPNSSRQSGMRSQGTRDMASLVQYLDSMDTLLQDVKEVVVNAREQAFGTLA
mmetsp:Transcript_15474/g.35367  ORF Transcript_15474/g.35367 Transcript_15474/m.35367 type:complete len:442 (+) Transcript_15474:52-1377(+)